MNILDNWWIDYKWSEKPNKNKRLNPLQIFAPRPEISVNPKMAAIDAVKKIVDRYPPPYNLLVSGGVDSQCMILAWVRSGVDFTITHYSYNGENSQDTDTLIMFCDIYSLKATIKTFDVREFIVSDEYTELAKKYDCASPHILTYIKLASQHDETVIMSGNFISRAGDTTAGVNYTILGLDRFRSISKSNFVPFFLLYTPELAHAFYDADINNQNIAVSKGVSNIEYFAKCKTYNESGFGVIPQINKFTGFENIRNSFDDTHVSPKLRMKYKSEKSNRPFDYIFRYSLYDHIGKYSEHTTINMNSN